MEFRDLATRMRAVEATTKRLEMAQTLADALRAASDEETPAIAYILLGGLAPDHEGLEVGLAEKLAIRAIQTKTGAGEAAVRERFVATGDLGTTAEELWEGGGGRAAQVGLGAFMGTTSAPLTVAEVHADLVAIARVAGSGSQDEKLKHAQRLLDQATAVEARYLVRFLVGKLRLGVADMTLLDAAAMAYAPDDEVPVEKDGLPRAPPEWRAAIERAYNNTSDIGRVFHKARTGGLAGLQAVQITPGLPVRPMLAERSTDPAEILERAGTPCLAEYKYDGLRIQAHLDGDVCRLFSRKLEDVTDQFPDVVAALRRGFAGKRIVVEGEAVPVDRKTGRLRPFQDISRRRGRKHDLAQMVEEIPVTLFIFDLLFLDGEDQTIRPLPERRAVLAAAFEPGDDLALSEGVEIETVADLEAFFEDTMARDAEGVMVKSLGADSTYTAGGRAWRWIKFKRDYVEALADSLDLVIVGAWHGKGRRRGWYGALLGAVRNSETGTYETVCKIGTGFTDSMLDALNARLDPHLTHTSAADVDTVMVPDVYFKPSAVCEVRGAELSRSPIHTAARTEEGGLAVRFPRFLRWREDKGPEQATTTDEVTAMFRRQRSRSDATS